MEILENSPRTHQFGARNSNISTYGIMVKLGGCSMQKKKGKTLSKKGKLFDCVNDIRLGANFRFQCGIEIAVVLKISEALTPRRRETWPKNAFRSQTTWKKPTFYSNSSLTHQIKQVFEQNVGCNLRVLPTITCCNNLFNFVQSSFSKIHL